MKKGKDNPPSTKEPPKIIFHSPAKSKGSDLDFLPRMQSNPVEKLDNSLMDRAKSMPPK